MFDTPKLQRPRQKGGEFRITHVLVGKFGKTEGCRGCLKHEGGPMANHSLECRQRFEEILLKDNVLRERLFARDIRAEEKAMEAEHRTRSIRGSSGSSTPVPRVMLNTSSGPMFLRVCARRLLFWGLWTVSPLHASEVGCARVCCCVVQWSSFCAASLTFPPRSRWFASLSTILSSWCVVSESANPWCAQHGGLAGDVSSGLGAGCTIRD